MRGQTNERDDWPALPKGEGPTHERREAEILLKREKEGGRNSECSSLFRKERNSHIEDAEGDLGYREVGPYVQCWKEKLGTVKAK